MRFPTMWYVRPAKSQIRLRIWGVKLLAEHHLAFLSLKGGYTDSSESALVKMPHCKKSIISFIFYLHISLFGVCGQRKLAQQYLKM